MTRILLARHGETDHNKNGILQGELDVDLNDTGIEQAQQLSERLRDEDINAVYASNLQRAQRTAEIVAGPHELEVETLAELREQSFGDLEGEAVDTVMDKVKQSGSPWHQWAPETGESLDDVSQRAIPALQQIRKSHQDETVLVVAHGGVNRSVLATLLGADSGHGHILRQENTCINELEFEDYAGWRINRVNDTGHLDGRQQENS